MATLVAASTLLVLSTGVAAKSTGGFRKGPYLQNVSRSSVTVMWQTTRSCKGGVRLLGADDAPDRTIAVEQDGGNEHIYEVTVDGLDAGRRYRYAVECQSRVVEGEFATAPEAGAPFTFVVMGDSRSNANTHRMMVERARREVPDFLVSTGDMVDNGEKEVQWQQFFDIQRELLRENVLFPALGNHDRQGRGRTADNFRKYFAVPENSPNPERYYAITYGSARFLILDSNAYSFSLTDQTAWIERQLQAARLDSRIEHIFVTMHHPPFSISLHGGQKELRERWSPLFEKYGVTAVFSGHDHVYSRAEKNNVRYFVSGGAGAPVYPRARRPSPIDVEATKYFERVFHYLRVHVIGPYVEVSAIRVDGTVIEVTSWGMPPRQPEPLLVESTAPAVLAAGDSVSEPSPVLRVPAAVTADHPGEAGTTGFGFLGTLGTAMMLLAGGVLIWTLRS